jgi:integrase
MAHVQKRCAARSCRRAVPPGTKVCPACRSRRFRHVARYRDPDGIERSQSFDRKIDAERHLTDQEGRKARNTWTDPDLGREVLASFWERWRTRAEAAGRPSQRTLIAYDELWRLYLGPALGTRTLASITRGDVEELVGHVGQRSPWRATDVLKVLRMLLNRAMAEDRIGRNPAARVAAPRIAQGEPWVLSPEEVERLADEAGERWRAFVLLAAYSSLRWSELIALRVDRLELPRRRLRVEEKITEHGRLIRGEPKTRHSRRAVSIPEFVALELAEHIWKHPPGPDGLVLTGPEGGPIRRPHFSRLVWKRTTRAAGLDGFPFKNLRHTGASLAIAAGANPLLVAARLGHTSTRMVERHYVSLFEGLDREIGDKLGVMREQRETESRRLRPAASQSLAGPMRDQDGASVLPMPSRNDETSR